METSLDQVWQGDEEALVDVLYSHYHRLGKKIKSQIPTELQDSLSEEDVLQDTFVAVFKSFPLLNKCSDAAFAAWLDSIAKNQLIDSIRHLRAKKRGGGTRKVNHVQRPSTGSIVPMVSLLLGPELTPSRHVAREEAAAALMGAIEDLPSDQQEAIRRRCLAGQSLADVADAMDRTPSAIRNLVHRAKETLRDRLRMSDFWWEKK